MRNPPAVVSTCMTATMHATSDRTKAQAAARVRRRLRPLYVAAWLLGINFWVPVEKLFLSQIGFTTATIGLLAATYAAVVPFLEIPSGILADRWSRRGVLVLADLALAGSALVGGLSTDVPTYLVSALLLGVYFALQSGTVDTIIYDVLVEETGRADGFERYLGRLRMWEGIALVASALAGGGIAAITSARFTYLLTVPFAALSIGALSRFTEPRLHRATDSLPLRRQVAATYRALVEPGRVRYIIVTMVLSALLLQMVLEFGPLWLVALAAPTFLYGPQWAGLMSAVGFGGLLAGRGTPSRPAVTATVITTMLAAALALTAVDNPIAVIAAQVVPAALLVAISTLLSRHLHDEIPSSLRAGVSSGVGTLTWIGFLPSAVAFGSLSRHAGVHTAAWIPVALTAATCAALLRLLATQHSTVTSHAVTRTVEPATQSGEATTTLATAAA
jgi:MFS family permease